MVRTSAGCALFLLVGCGAPQRPAVMASPPPAAEFLVATLDSTFWVRSGPAGIRFRGAPLTLATFGGRFYEIFLADDDRSFDEALLVGQRIYRRDLLDGDSSLVFEDSIVPRIAREYARAHPAARPLEPEEEGAEDPATQATAELEIIGLHGPYLSYEYHVDVAVPGGEPWHTTRRGVLDLRSGRTMRVRDIFADSVAARLARQGRQAFRTAIDSLRIASGPDAEVSRRASLAVGQLSFDDRSFVLTVVESQLAVEFDIPERGPSVSDDVLPLTPVLASSTRWWSEVRSRFPLSEDDLDRWRRVTEAGYDVVARYDSTGERARLTISDSSLHEWQITNIAAPVLHTFWLDHPAIDSVQRRALGRAFDAASLYDETTRTVRGPLRWHAPPPSRAFAFSVPLPLPLPLPLRQPTDMPSRPQKTVKESQHESSELMMPGDANNLGHIFGGVILSMMDKTAAIAAFRHSRASVVTASIDRVDFREPIHLGDLVVMKASVNFAGRTSMEVGVRVEAEELLTGRRRHTNSCYLTFVAVDANGRPVEVPELIPETPDEQRRYEAAKERRARRLEEREREERRRVATG